MESSDSTGGIAQRFTTLQAEVNSLCTSLRREKGCTIIGVSKTKPVSDIEAALQGGITEFGENYAQEFREKAEYFAERTPRPQWHFIGHLQTNKVKYVVPHVYMLHSIDSLRLAQEVEKQAVKNNRTVKILLQVHTSGEETKFGCLPTEAVALAQEIITLPHLQLCGMMTLAKFSDDPEEVRPMFKMLNNVFQETQHTLQLPYFTELSMGMTNDYRVAIQEGATMIRVGTAIFGERNYN